MITPGAWWDHVDELSHRVGELLDAWPSTVRPFLVEWAHGEDIWLRRSSIICQLGFRSRTDLDLLAEAIEASAGRPEFFLRKAIGWALRDLARSDPGWVRSFVEGHELSPLSRREALKHLP
jgi:3-methyladenine DNA glycosylase AlkD